LKKIRVGVIGCGWIAQTAHIPALLQNPRADLVAICESNETLLATISDKHGIRNCFHDYRELVQSGLVDAVSVCTPTASHGQVALAAVRNGIHVLCEKPLASDLSEAKAVMTEVQKRNVRFMVGYNYRFLPNHVKTKEFIQSGKIGEPVLVRAELVAPGPYRSARENAEVRREASKRIGAFFDLGSHIADLLLWMIGDAEEVYGLFSMIENNAPIDGTAAVLVRFRRSVLGNIMVRWQDMPDYEAISRARTVEVIGTKGRIESQLLGPSLFFYSPASIMAKIRGETRITPAGVDPRVPDDAIKQSYRKEINSFLNAVLKDEDPPITINDGFKALKLVIAAYDSSKLGRPVSLE
jgi:predicted dehydrogenase